MKRWWDGWLSLLERREGAEPLALCRMMAGVGLLASVWLVLPSGTWRVLWVDAAWGGYRDLGGMRPGMVMLLMALTMAAGTGLALGWKTRWMALGGLFLFNSLIWLNPHDGSAYDSLLTNQLLLLGVSGAGATWSIDAWRRTGRWAAEAEAPTWPRLVMVLQLILCYWATGVQKISTHWLPGGELSALHYILQDPFWARWDLRELLPGMRRVIQGATAASWWFEVAAPVWLLAVAFREWPEWGGRVGAWSRRARVVWWFALFGVLFHLGIHGLMRVGPFSWIILSYYPALLRGADGRRLQGWRGRS